MSLIVEGFEQQFTPKVRTKTLISCGMGMLGFDQYLIHSLISPAHKIFSEQIEK